MKTSTPLSLSAAEGRGSEDQYIFVITRDPNEPNSDPMCWQAFASVERDAAMDLLRILRDDFRGRDDREVHCIEGRWGDVMVRHRDLLGSYADDPAFRNPRI